MKIILLKDVNGLGQKFDLKNVSPGYARNYLFPNGFAELATKEKIASLDARKAKLGKEQLLEADEKRALVNRLNGKVVPIKAKANEEGHLFAGIHAEEIRDAIKKELGVSLSIEMIECQEPIKSIGNHEIKIKFGDKEGVVILEVGRKEEL